MKVAIIGGGLTGLTAAFRLLQKGVEPIVFEKEVLVGGRISYSVDIITEGLHKRFGEITQELGLGPLKRPLATNELGFLSADGLIKAEELPEMLKSFPKKEVAAFQEMVGFALSLSFSPRNFSPELKELRKKSFDSYLGKKFSEKMKNLCIAPMNLFGLAEDLKNISADYGLFNIRFCSEILAGKSYTFEGNNVLALIGVLEKKIKEISPEVLFTWTEVKKIKKAKKGFEIYFEREAKEEVMLVDKVVLTLPLSLIREIFPDLKLKGKFKYNDTKCILTRGKLRYGRKAYVGIKTGNKANILFYSGIIPEEHHIYPFDSKKKVDLESIYEEYEILGEKDLKPALLFLPPGAVVPELKTEIEGVYLCGDFYFYPSMETAVTTAEMVAEMIG